MTEIISTTEKESITSSLETVSKQNIFKRLLQVIAAQQALRFHVSCTACIDHFFTPGVLIEGFKFLQGFDFVHHMTHEISVLIELLVTYSDR